MCNGPCEKNRWLLRGREQRRLRSLSVRSRCAQIGQRALDGDIRQHALALDPFLTVVKPISL